MDKGRMLLERPLEEMQENMVKLQLALPDGAELTGTIRVNQPMRAGRYKIYQSSYEYAGQVDVRTSPDGEDERASLDSAAFLTLDGKSGIGLIERVRQGQGKPAKIYIKNFAALCPP